MKKVIISLVSGALIGILFFGIIMYKSAPGMMLKEDESKYNFEQTVVEFEKSVKQKGWKIPATHNLQKTMEKFGHDVRAVKVYELCHPDHAEKILSKNHERVVSSMMPCRVAIYEKADGKTYVSRMNTSMMAGMIGGVVKEVMAVASTENEEILKAVIK